MNLIAKKDFVHGDDVIKAGDPLTTNTANGGNLINRGLCVLAQFHQSEPEEEVAAETHSPAPAKKAAKKSATKK